MNGNCLIYVFVVHFVVELNGTIHPRSTFIRKQRCGTIYTYAYVHVWVIKVVFEENFVSPVSRANEFIQKLEIGEI